VLSVAALDILWEMLGLGAFPVVFDMPSVGGTTEDRARLREIIFRDLTSRNLANRGRGDAEVEEVLVLLSRFGWAIDVAFKSTDGDEITVRGAANDRLAVLARKTGQLIHFTTLRPDALLHTVVTLIGQEKPGSGKAVTYPDADSAPAPTRPTQQDDDEGFGSVMQHVRPPAGGHDLQRRAAQSILGKPRKQGGWFHVIGRDRNNREVHPPAVIWFDTDDGRYLMYQRPGSDGQPWWTCTPADPSRIAHALRTAL
jgi:hypothetical protein